MQRQSLGSPVSKLHFHGGSLPKHDATIPTDDNSCKASSSLSPYDDLRLKTAKPSSRRLSSSASSSLMPPSPHPANTPEKLIHLIPIVVLFCFLVLYLVSHNPASQPNTLQFDVFENTGEMNSVLDKLTAVKAKDALTIRSFRNLQETEEGGNKQESRSLQRHRKSAGL
ncbi:hypothetical protein LINGRAHAP2_LOCUS25123 [Linum grandiflorum]